MWHVRSRSGGAGVATLWTAIHLLLSCSVVCVSVCRSVCLSLPWALQNGWTYRGPVWGKNSGGPKEPCCNYMQYPACSQLYSVGGGSDAAFRCQNSILQHFVHSETIAPRSLHFARARRWEGISVPHSHGWKCHGLAIVPHIQTIEYFFSWTKPHGSFWYVPCREHRKFALCINMGWAVAELSGRGGEGGPPRCSVQYVEVKLCNSCLF